MLQRLTSRQRTLLACLVAGCSGLTGVPSALAQTEASAAQALFDEAKLLMAQGDYELACPKLEESQRLDPALGTLLNLADCREKQGKLASAWSLFRDAESLARRSGPPDAAAVARQRAELLQQRVPRLVLRVTQPAPAALRLSRDDVEVGVAQLGTPIPLDPGTYRLSAAAPGYASWQRTVTLRESGGLVTVTIPALPRLPSAAAVPKTATPAAAVPKTATPAAATPAVEEGRAVPELTWVLGGAGVAALGASIGLGLVAKAQYDSANCPQHVCVSKGDLEQRQRARTNASAATFCFVGGSLAVGTGVVLWALTPNKERRQSELSLSAGVSELRVSGTF